MKYALNIAFILLFGGTLSGARAEGNAAFGHAVSLCTAIADPKIFDGRSLQFRAVYRIEPHGAVLTDHACPNSIVLLTKSADFSEDPAAKTLFDSLLDEGKTNTFDVVYAGTFRIVDGLHCSEVNCFDYELNVSRLVAVRRLRRPGD